MASPSPAATEALPGWRHAARRLLVDSWSTSLTLYRIIVPIGLATRILDLLGVIDFLGRGLAPLMSWLGLPGSMGLVWATTMVTNIYGGMVVFVTLAPEARLTAAQATVLGTMILVAHSLPVELRIAQKAGVRLRSMLILRVGGAMLLGAALMQFYRLTGWLQTPCRIRLPAVTSSGWGDWTWGLLKTMAMIYLIILVLLALMGGLERIGLMARLKIWLNPVLRLVGLSPSAAPLAIVGLLLGLSYGGGLIIAEAQSGRLSRRDIWLSLALMSLCHSVIEDTLVLMLTGAHQSGLLWARLGFAIGTVALLARLLDRLPESWRVRLFYRPSHAPPVPS